jgi:hypothetical protein
MSAGNSGKLPELSGFNENGFENVDSTNGMAGPPAPLAEVGTGETVATSDITGLDVATGEPAEAAAAAPNTTRKKGRDYTTQAQVLADINEAIKRLYPEDKRKAHIAVVGPALKAKKEGTDAEYREAVDLAAERVHQGLSFPKRGAVAAPTLSKRRSRLTNALNAARAQANNGTSATTMAATAMNQGTVAPKPPRRRTAATAAPSRNTALANAFPRNSNSVAPISASATTNEKERLLTSLTTMRDSAKEMIDSMYAAANKLARGAAASNNGGLLRTINSSVPSTVTRKVRKNKGVPRGSRTTAKVAPLSTIPEETNSAIRGEESETARVNNLSALEPSPIEAAQQDEETALGTAEN